MLAAGRFPDEQRAAFSPRASRGSGRFATQHSRDSDAQAEGRVGRVFRRYAPFLKMFASYLKLYETWSARCGEELVLVLSVRDKFGNVVGEACAAAQVAASLRGRDATEHAAVRELEKGTFELRLLPPQDFCPTSLRLRGHRDELIAVEQELGRPLNLHSDGELLSSPV